MDNAEKNISALTSPGPIRSYELNGSLSDSLGGPLLISFGGNITSNGYVFGRNQGLSLTGALSNIENYTIIIDITFNTLGPKSWQKILDFKNRTSDNGLYAYNSGGNHGLQFYPYYGTVGTILAGRRCRCIITRSFSGEVKTYVDNSSQFIFNDTDRKAVPDNNILLFGIDDFVVPDENDTGTIHKIEIYSVPLTEPSLPTLPPTATPVPTPTPTPTPNPGDCDRVMVFSICNANSVTDDNFNIYLNENLIGMVNLSAMDLVGSIFIASDNPNFTVTDTDFACPLSKMVKYNFNPSFVLEGSNTVRMENIQRNNHGNWGIVGIRNYSVDGSVLKSPCYINNLEYSGGDGTSFDFTFEYNQCCYEDPGIPTTCNIPCFNVKFIKSGANTWEGTDEGENKITLDLGSDDLTISDSKGLAYWNKTITNWKSNIIDGVLSVPGCEKIKIGGFCDAGNNDCVEIFEQGFIGDNQEGSIRRYSWSEDKGFFYKDGSIVGKSPWTINGNKVRIDFENDINCEKYNKNIQKSTCKIYLHLVKESNVTIGWEGKAEVQDSCYERMQIKINGSKSILAHSVGGKKGCDQVEDVVSVPLNPYSKILPKGLNVIEISVDTLDPLYHSGAYYEFTIDPFSCCKCSLEILDIIEKETLMDGSRVYEVLVKNDSGNCCGLEFKSHDGTWLQVPKDNLDCSLLASDNKIIATILNSWVTCPTPTPTPTARPTILGCIPNCESNLILNGNFELDTPGTDGGTAQHWSVSSVDVTSVELTGINKNVWVDLNSCSPGYIEQSFSTVVGQQYTLYFNMGANNFCTPSNPCGARQDNTEYNKTFRVSVAGIIQNYSFDITGTPNLIPGRRYDYSGIGWISQSLIFTAIDSTTTLRFESTCSSCGCFGPAVDCIEVCTDTATPTSTPTETPVATPTPTPTATLVCDISSWVAIGYQSVTGITISGLTSGASRISTGSSCTINCPEQWSFDQNHHANNASEGTIKAQELITGGSGNTIPFIVGEQVQVFTLESNTNRHNGTYNLLNYEVINDGFNDLGVLTVSCEPIPTSTPEPTPTPTATPTKTPTPTPGPTTNPLNYSRSTSNNTSHINWGLLRSIIPNNISNWGS